MKILCWFGFHKWITSSKTKLYEFTGWNNKRMTGVTVYQFCEKCTLNRQKVEIGEIVNKPNNKDNVLRPKQWQK